VTPEVESVTEKLGVGGRVGTSRALTVAWSTVLTRDAKATPARAWDRDFMAVDSVGGLDGSRTTPTTDGARPGGPICGRARSSTGFPEKLREVQRAPWAG